MISQTEDTITLDYFAFPAKFLRDRGFPALPDGIRARYYNPESGQFSMSDGNSQLSAGDIPWKDGESFLDKAKNLYEEYAESQQQPESNTFDSNFHPDRFLLNVAQSQLYQLGKNSQGQARIEFEEVREIINGRLLLIPEAIAPDGLLQKNLNELVAALGDEATEEAIAEFNQLLKDDLGVDWTIN